MNFEPTLSATERGIYEYGCRRLLAAIVAGRENGECGQISLRCGLDGVRGQRKTFLRQAEVTRDTKERVVIEVVVAYTPAGA